MKKAFPILIVIVSIFASVVALDKLWGVLIPTPKYLNKNKFWGYDSNYRNYFKEVEVGGRVQFVVPNDELEEKDPHEKSYDGLRVLSIGDSFTWGIGVKASDTYSGLLSRLTQDKVRSLRYGFRGFEINHLTDQLLSDESLVDKSYDYVIYGFCPNDFINRVPNNYLDFDLEGFKNNEYKNDYPLKWDFINLRTVVIDKMRSPLLKTLGEHSHVINHILRKIEMREIGKNTIRYYQKVYHPTENAEGWKETFSHLEKMRKWSHDRGAKFVVMLFPFIYWPDNQYFLDKEYDLLIEKLTKSHYKYIDLRASFFKYRDSELWVHPVDQHPNDIAHRLAAKETLKFIGI